MTKNATFVPTPETDRLFKGVSRSTRTVISFDAANLDNAERDLGLNIDYVLLRRMLEHYTDVAYLNYFTVKPQEEVHNSSGIMGFHDFLDFNGYRVHYKPSSLTDENRSGVVNKTNIDVDLAVETMRSIYSDQSIGQLILFSGDADFISLVRAIRHHVKVIVISTERTARPYLSKNLKKASDIFVDLSDVGKHIQRPNAVHRQPSPIVGALPCDQTITTQSTLAIQ